MKKGQIDFITMGCSKNLVDSEILMKQFEANGYHCTHDSEKIDGEIVVINTCGFIESAKEEAINTILEMAKYKKKNCKFLIVTGCLTERYKEDLTKSLPEVDLFIKFSEYDTIWEQIAQLINNKNNAKTINVRWR